jgi:hypothetical protein
MEERIQSPRDIIRQQELLDAIHVAYAEQLTAAGTVDRLLFTDYGSVLAAPESFVLPCRILKPEGDGTLLDITALKVGVKDQPQSQYIVGVGYIGNDNEPVSFGEFLPRDVELIESMLEGLRQDYNLAILPNLSENYSEICDQR